MAEKKKLTDKEKEDIAFKNMAIDYIGQLHGKVSQMHGKVSHMEQSQMRQAKYQAKQAKTKVRAKKRKSAKKIRNLTGFKDSLDRKKWLTFGGNPFDK